MKKNVDIIRLFILFAAIILILSFSSKTFDEYENAHILDSELFVYIDEEKEYSLESLVDSKVQFKTYIESGVSSTMDDATYWVKIPLENFVFANDDYLLEIAKPHLDFITFYQVDANQNLLLETETGRQRNFDTREISYRNYLFEIVEDQESTIYLKIETDSYLQVPGAMWEKSDYIESSNLNSLIFGLFYGAAIIMVVYNLLLAISLKDVSYLYYVLFVSAYTLLQTVWDGFSYQYLWINQSSFDVTANPLFINQASIWLLFFTYSFFKIGKYKSRTRKVYRILMAAMLVLSPLSFIISYKLAVNLTMFFGGVSLLIEFYTAFKNLNRSRSAFVFLIAWGAFFLMSLITIFAAIKWIPYSLIVVHGSKIGFIILITLFSIALSNRFKEMDEQKVIEQEKQRLATRLKEITMRTYEIKDVESLMESVVHNYHLIVDGAKIMVSLTNELGETFVHSDKGMDKLFCEVNNEVSKITIDDGCIYHFPIATTYGRNGHVTMMCDFVVDELTIQQLIDYTKQIELTLENIRLLSKLRFTANHDGLTKLSNRVHFFEQGDILFKSHDQVAVMMFDIDFFKHINDNYGHQAGDLVLVEFSKILNDFKSENVRIARYGGEEFIVLTVDQSKEEVITLAENIRKTMMNHVFTIQDSNRIDLTVSGGVAFKSKLHHSLFALSEEADEYLYEAKENGRNQISKSN